jgi:hypothetical protein
MATQTQTSGIAARTRTVKVSGQAKFDRTVKPQAIPLLHQYKELV